MKEIIKLGAGAFGKLILVNFLCAIVVLSVSIITSNIFSEEIGINVYGVSKDGSEPEFLYSHLDEDGEDTKRAEYEAKGYKDIEEYPITRSTKTGDAVFLSISQLLCWGTLAAIVYPTFWKNGSKDRNQVYFGHIAEDKLKGLKAGVIAIVPAILLFAFFAVTKFNICSNFPAVWLKFLNANAYSFIDLLQNKVLNLSEISVYKFLIMILTQLTVPLIGWGGYLLGYKDIAIGEKLLYKKKEI